MILVYILLHDPTCVSRKDFDVFKSKGSFFYQRWLTIRALFIETWRSDTAKKRRSRVLITWLLFGEGYPDVKDFRSKNPKGFLDSRDNVRQLNLRANHDLYVAVLMLLNGEWGEKFDRSIKSKISAIALKALFKREWRKYHSALMGTCSREILAGLLFSNRLKFELKIRDTKSSCLERLQKAEKRLARFIEIYASN